MKIRLTGRQLENLLAGNIFEITHRSTRSPELGESYRVTLHESSDVRALIVNRDLVKVHKRNRDWKITVALDRQAQPLLLNAESQTAISQLPESVAESAPEAHGYTTIESRALGGEGEAVEHEEVNGYAHSQQAALIHAWENVDTLSKRRARSVVNRTRDVLMQAQAKGIDTSPWIESIEGELRQLEDEIRSVGRAS